MENNDKKLTRVIAAILTVAFLGFVFTAFGAMLLESGTEIYDSTRLMSQLKAYLPADWNQFDLLQARISSFTSTVADKMWLKEDMGYVNSGFQYGLGKRMINTGSQNMLTLTTGHLYGRYLLPGHTKRGSVQLMRRTKDGRSYFRDDSGSWRMLTFFDGVYSLDIPDSPKTFYYAGRAFGKFVKEMADVDLEDVKIVIRNLRSIQPLVN